MAHDRYSQWQAEQAGTHTLPTGGGVLGLAVLVVLLVLALQAFGATDSGDPQVDRKAGVSLCDEHPHWSVCQPEPAKAKR